MSDAYLQRIADYMMPALPPAPSDLGFLFGTRHGVDAFCDEAISLWNEGMFGRLLVSGGATAGIAQAEAKVIAGRLLRLGMPSSALILECAATNTGENVRFDRAAVAAVTDVADIRSVVLIGKICSARRYLMTMQRHWPGLRMSVCAINYFGVPAARWYEDATFKARILGEFGKIPAYLAQGFLAEVDEYTPHPKL